ncbi:MAG: sdaA [Chlamydiales bacterium]|jgi:L-serine dehydratase|nr:sdaA [Chlamydiales bacterium]
MTISVFDLFSIGIGPSSSHTVGPMRAARQFLASEPLPVKARRIKVELYGSLALTGLGHGTDKAVLLGLNGHTPEDVDPNCVDEILLLIRQRGEITLLGKHTVPFQEERDLLFHGDKLLPFHSNGMRFTLYDEKGLELKQRVFYSIGGGFILDSGEEKTLSLNSVPYPFKSASEMQRICSAKNWTIKELMLANERTFRSEEAIAESLLKIASAMQDCMARGLRQEGVLPGGLNVPRRARHMHSQLLAEQEAGTADAAQVLDWVSLWALAVNEENAAGGRVVTAPTNGAAGIIPAVLKYYLSFTKNPTDEGVCTYLLVAGAIGILYKEGASISAAEVGCQGEIGVACSMAAGGLAAALGGTNAQIENAAEIGMEHNLGLTCDPVKGLVQIPCIERNTMGAIKAINACRLALRGNGGQIVSLDQVIKTMYQTGLDMQMIYKETSQGGLAVNVTAC